MKIKETVFDSESERRIFRKLESNWSSMFYVWPQMPLSSIVEVEAQDLVSGEREEFLKTFNSTRVDYTFCDKRDRPLFSIEFDGIGGGFSRNGKYIQISEESKRKNKYNLEFKLRVTKSVGYPLIIVSFDETESIDEEDSLMILDGIIGQIMTQKEFERLITSVPGGDVNAARVVAESTYDFIAKKAWDYYMILDESSVMTDIIREPLTKPALPDWKGWYDIEGLESIVEAMKEPDRQHGYRVVIKTLKIDIVQPPVWVRNIEGFGICPSGLAENIAEYLAFKKAHTLLVAE